MSDPIKEKQTSRALILTNLLTEPLFTLYSFLAFILCKDLGASVFQITLLTALKPLVPILAFYWSAGLKGRAAKLKSNVLWAGFLMRAPFLLCPWVDSVWFVIGAAVNYMFFYRAGIPGWLEMIKRGVGAEKRNRMFSIGSALGYAEGVLLSLACGGLLDQNPGAWKGLFFGAALLGLVPLAVQARLKVESEEVPEERLSLKETLVRPWRDSYRLMKERRDFSLFQWGFMISGFGLMLFQPILPIFAAKVLGISHMEMAGAFSIARGLGFSLSSPWWGKWIDRAHVFKVASLVFLMFGLSALLLSFSVWHLVWLYVAYFCYGVAQGGSHLVWHMSGPIFAGKEESSTYSGVNVAMVGLRGAVGPPLGGVLAALLGPVQVILIGGALCVYSSIRMLRVKVATKATA